MSAIEEWVLDEMVGRTARLLKARGAAEPMDELSEISEMMVRLWLSYFAHPAGTFDMADPVSVREFATRRLAPMISG